jgi:hypothetical protein
VRGREDGGGALKIIIIIIIVLTITTNKETNKIMKKTKIKKITKNKNKKTNPSGPGCRQDRGHQGAHEHWTPFPYHPAAQGYQHALAGHPYPRGR